MRPNQYARHQPVVRAHSCALNTATLPLVPRRFALVRDISVIGRDPFQAKRFGVLKGGRASVPPNPLPIS